MSVFIKKSKLRVKNEDGTSYTGVMNAVAEESTEELIKQIEAKGEEVVAKGKKTLESIPEDYTVLEEKADELKEDLAYIAEKHICENLIDYNASKTGYYDLSGVFHESDEYRCSELIDVSAYTGKTLFYSRLIETNIVSCDFAFITEYDNDGNVVRISNAKQTNSYTVPLNGVTSIIVSSLNAYLTEYTMLTEGSVPSEFKPFFEDYMSPKDSFVEVLQNQIEENKKEIEELKSVVDSVNYAKISNVSRLGSASIVNVKSVVGNTVEFSTASASGGVYFDVDIPLTAGHTYICWALTNVENTEGARLYLYNNTTSIRYVTAFMLYGMDHLFTLTVLEGDTPNRLAFITRNATFDGNVTLYVVDVTNASDLLVKRMNRPDGYLTFGEPMNIGNPFGWFYGKKQSFLGDSNTAYGRYEPIIQRKLGMSDFVNCGVSGSSLGGKSENAFWRDSRINALAIDSDIISVMGGTNDAASGSVAIGDAVLTNHDTDTFIGAYNLIISKILYKFMKVDGYYSDVDYSGITQVDAAKDIEIVLYTPIYSSSAQYQNNGKLKQIVDACKAVGEMWGIPVIDCYHNSQFNVVTAPVYYQDGVHLTLHGGQLLGGYIANQMRTICRH